MEDDKLANHSPSLLATSASTLQQHSGGGSSSNGHSTLNINGSSALNGASSYENALKKLVHILKLKASDNLKQLEDLWDSINAPPPPPQQQALPARPLAKSGHSVSPRTTPSPPLFNNSSSCSNSSTISESSSPSPTSSSSSSSSSSPSPPRVTSSSTKSTKQPASPGKPASKSEAANNLKRDASKLSTTTEGQEAKKTKLNAAGALNPAKKSDTSSSVASKTSTGPKTNAAKKDDKPSKPATATAKASAGAKTSKTVKELTSEAASKPVKRELDTAEPVSQPERPSSLSASVALVSVRDEELSQLGEGKSIEISFDAPVMMDNASSLSGAVVTSQAADDHLLEGNAKRFKLDLADNSTNNGEVTTTSGAVDLSETTQVDLDDMLTGLSCSVCKKFNQETNNKLIECRNCKYMFHQLCHRPPLAHDELDEQYVSKCSECMNPSSDGIELSSSSSAHVADDPSSSSMQHSKEPPGSALASKTTTNADSSSATAAAATGRQTQGQQLFAMKGLAALATKFSPAQTPTVSSKNNDLFNKLKQSASTATTPGASESGVKSKNPFIQTSQPVSQLQQQQQKRNIFNMSASTTSTANAIPVTVASPSGDKRAK